MIPALVEDKGRRVKVSSNPAWVQSDTPTQHKPTPRLTGAGTLSPCVHLCVTSHSAGLCGAPHVLWLEAPGQGCQASLWTSDSCCSSSKFSVKHTEHRSPCQPPASGCTAADQQSPVSIAQPYSLYLASFNLGMMFMDCSSWKSSLQA